MSMYSWFGSWKGIDVPFSFLCLLCENNASNGQDILHKTKISLQLKIGRD